MIEPLINAVTALWFGLLGGCVGSFLNVVAYRLPLGMSVIWKPSHCPHCQHAIRMRDNVPVFGWLLLRGRCRDCGQPIAVRYAVVELTLGLIFFLLAYAELFRGGANLPGGPLSPLTGAIDNVCYPNWPLLGLYAYHGTLLAMLLAILLINLDGHRVPLRLVVFGLALGLLPAVVWPWLHPTLVHSTLEPGGEVGRFQAGLHLVAGIALGALLGAVIGAIPTNQRESAGQPRNVIIAMAMVGAFLGWRAALTTTVGTLGAAVVCRGLLRRWPNLHASATGLAMLAATLVQIVWWDHIAGLGS
jgi:leader peptidase (prepilin peptidase)/N-methyltransferase